MKFKITTGPDGKWYVYRKYPITGTDKSRWVIESTPSEVREDAVDKLPEDASVIDTLICST